MKDTYWVIKTNNGYICHYEDYDSTVLSTKDINCAMMFQGESYCKIFIDSFGLVKAKPTKVSRTTTEIK